MVGDQNERTGRHSDTNTTNQVKQPVGDREYEDIEKRFTPRPLSPGQRDVISPIMFASKDLATHVIEQLPGNRERALALTKLEEFTSWCEKSLIHGNI